MKTSNKLLVALLILMLLSGTTIVGAAKYYQTKGVSTDNQVNRR